MSRFKLSSLLVALFLYSSIVGYDFSDNVPPSQNPPGELSPDQVPMFVSIGWDDNSASGGDSTRWPGEAMTWALKMVDTLNNPAGNGNSGTFDSTPVRFSFYSNSCYMYQSGFQGDYVTVVKWIHNKAYRNGHEIGNHTNKHQDGRAFSTTQWATEIDDCQNWLTLPAPVDSDSISKNTGVETEGAGIKPEDIQGFRTPFLFYNDNVFTVLKEKGFHYDCSIEEGFQEDQDGTNFLWPYTLDNGSPGHEMQAVIGNQDMANIKVNSHPGLWEMPAYAVVVPPDSLCDKYGVPTGFRSKMSWYPGFDVNAGKITGLDYNMWGYNKARMNRAEFTATLKYTLDLRMQGNRAPFLFGAHTQYYVHTWNAGTNAIELEDRQGAIEDFIYYALETYPEVRIVPYKDVLAWIRNPVPLGPTAIKTSKKDLMNSVKIGSLKNKQLSFSVPQRGEYLISILTPNGRVVYSEKKQCDAIGAETLSLKGHLNSGLFFVTIDKKGMSRSTGKLIIQ